MGENLFVTFTGLAALVHSTWSLGTLFAGKAPEGDWFALFVWLCPAFLVAFSMDIGQISTSAKIRHDGLTWQRCLAFFVFAVATYYLQFLYIAHHMPALEIAPGISEFHHWAVQTGRDAAIWILPLLLPLSTMLYTISDGDKKEQPSKPLDSGPAIVLTAPENPMLEEESTDIAMVQIELIPQAKFAAHCDDCGWHKEYDDSKRADRALNTHKSIHCSARHEQKVMAQNGHIG